MAPNDPPIDHTPEYLRRAMVNLRGTAILTTGEKFAVSNARRSTPAGLADMLVVLASAYVRQSERDPVNPGNLAVVQSAINATVAALAQVQASASRAVDCVTVTGSPHKVEIEGDIMEQIRTGTEGLRKDELGVVVAASTEGKSLLHSKDEDAAFVEQMFERSKDNREIIVGSEIRKLCMIARRALTSAKPLERRCQSCGKSAQVHVIEEDASITVCPHCWHVVLASRGGLVSTLVPAPDKPAKIAKKPLLDGAPVGTIGTTVSGRKIVLVATPDDDEDSPEGYVPPGYLGYRWSYVTSVERFVTDATGRNNAGVQVIRSISYPAPGHTRVTKEA